jgi:low affinity Fe/Cu permease
VTCRGITSRIGGVGEGGLPVNDFFRRFSNWVSEVTGSSWAFIAAITVIILWAITGPVFHFSDTWQLVINTGTTIVTFLMVFLIQNTQNRDARAVHLKLDELLRAVEGARTGLVDLENSTDEELQQVQDAFQRLKEREPALEECLEEIEGEVQEAQKDLREDSEPAELRNAA